MAADNPYPEIKAVEVHEFDRLLHVRRKLFLLLLDHPAAEAASLFLLGCGADRDLQAERDLD